VDEFAKDLKKVKLPKARPWGIWENKKYGIKRLNVHGIGELNSKKIKEFIKILEQEPNPSAKIISRDEQDNRIFIILEI